ncbi:MAG TPA: hypothetical protein VN714_35530 [Trebonia sp.]|nr:hypothetical protein [Trebonia sp.]
MTDSSVATETPTLAARLVRLGVVLGFVVILQAGLVAAFVTATRDPAPHQLPVAVVGTPRETAALQSRLSGTGAFAVRLEPTLAAAQGAIRRQEVYGALLPTSHPATLLVASAASPLVAQVLTKAFTAAAQQSDSQLAITDVAPLPADDPRGTVGPYLVLGLLIGGYVGAMVIGRLIGMRSPSVRHLGLRLAVLACYAAVAAAAGVVLVGPVLGVLHGNALAIFATGGLVAFAVGCFTSALQTLLGLVGTLLSVITLVLIGNPAAGGGQIPSAMMSPAWGWLAHVLPNPAGMAAIRGIEFFGGNGTGQAFAVLSVYAAAGIVVMLVMAAVPAGSRRGQASAERTELATDLAAETGSGAML